VVHLDEVIRNGKDLHHPHRGPEEGEERCREPDQADGRAAAAARQLPAGPQPEQRALRQAQRGFRDPQGQAQDDRWSAARSDLDRRHAALLKSCFETLRDLLAKYSKENGILLVHLVPNADLQTSNTSEIQLQMGLQSLLYYDQRSTSPSRSSPTSNSHYAAPARADAPAPAPADPAFGPAPPPAARRPTDREMTCA
jgi:hypothetical protein